MKVGFMAGIILQDWSLQPKEKKQIVVTLKSVKFLIKLDTDT